MTIGVPVNPIRAQLGSAPLEGLFAQCCRPLCSAQTPGAYRFGRRLVALDGTRQDVADTPANAATFARPSNQYGPGPFPQIRLLLRERVWKPCQHGSQRAEQPAGGGDHGL